MDIEWDACTAPEWDRLSALAGCASLEQSWAYGEALAAVRNCRPRRAVVWQGGVPLALVQAFESGAVLPLKPVRILRGPLWLAERVSAVERARVLRLIKERYRLGRRELLIWSPELADSPESCALMRSCGMRRMVTGYATALLDLTQPLEALRTGLRGKWRNRLVAAERSDLDVRVAGGGRDLEWLIEQADRHRRRHGYLGTPAALVRALAGIACRNEGVLVLTAAAAGEKVAGAVVIRHARTATYLLGWSADAGRRRNAQNRLLWRAVTELRAQGLEWLDLGGINASAPGVARFKLGMGARPHVLAGTFI